MIGIFLNQLLKLVPRRTRCIQRSHVRMGVQVSLDSKKPMFDQFCGTFAPFLQIHPTFALPSSLSPAHISAARYGDTIDCEVSPDFARADEASSASPWWWRWSSVCWFGRPVFRKNSQLEMAFDIHKAGALQRGKVR